MTHTEIIFIIYIIYISCFFHLYSLLFTTICTLDYSNFGYTIPVLCHISMLCQGQMFKKKEREREEQTPS